MNFVYLEQADSTNKYAREHIEDFLDKTLVYTYHQTAGRGRLNRRWDYAGEDNIYASLILKPSDKMEEVYSNLTQYLSVVIANTIAEYNISPQIKWPNDVRINKKKIAGILAEGVIEKGTLKGIVLGFGININADKLVMERINQPATSLNIELGHTVDKEKFLKKLLDCFCLRYDSFIACGFPVIKNEYVKYASFLGEEITVQVFDNKLTGVAKDITDKGALRLIDNENKEHTLLIGDIL